VQSLVFGTCPDFRPTMPAKAGPDLIASSLDQMLHCDLNTACPAATSPARAAPHDRAMQRAGAGRAACSILDLLPRLFRHRWKFIHVF
jgi:hypothetical protein